MHLSQDQKKKFASYKYSESGEQITLQARLDKAGSTQEFNVLIYKDIYFSELISNYQYTIKSIRG